VATIGSTSATWVTACFELGTTAIAHGVSIENARGSSAADTLYGTSAANILDGGDGNDTLDGRAGADTLIGGLGNDSYWVDNPGDRVIETSTLANEIDSVYASLSWTLGANLENLTLLGTNDSAPTATTWTTRSPATPPATSWTAAPAPTR
jgi:hypothetical protein